MVLGPPAGSEDALIDAVDVGADLQCGDLHAHGKDAIAFYTEQKVIMSRWF